MRTGYLGLGSNVGDPAAHLRAAVDLLGERGVEVDAVSSTYVTEPVGEVLDQPDFLNAAVRIRTALEPEELLDVCKAIEAERGRVLAAPRHSPRPLDVDLLLLGDLELATERLTLPHPEVRSRRFVLAPLLELDPELTLPDGTRLADALAALAARPAGRSWWAARLGRGLAAPRRGASQPGGRIGGVWPGYSGAIRRASCPAGRSSIAGPQVVERHRQPQRGRDLEVGGVRLRAADHAVGDPGVDLVEHVGEARRASCARSRRRIR